MNKKYLILVSFFFSFIKVAFSQYPWTATNMPSEPRYEDVYFLNKDTGFAVANTGCIYRTLDGGQNWDTVYTGTAYLRSIEFASSKRGFAGGLLSNSQTVFMKTLDGGNTWISMTNLIPISNKGICGLCSVDTNVTYAVGVWSSPAFLLKTTDGGLNWTFTDMSAYASRLVDVKFTDQNTGYVVGRSNIAAEGGVILKTTDGGLTWSKVFVTNTSGDYVWKIQSLDNINWFCSVERTNLNGPNKIIKSTDGGNTWVDKIVSYSSNYLQMVGFINANRGWAGSGQLFETNDGGNTWLQIPSGDNSFNRFFRLDSSFAYVSGAFIYKYNSLTADVKENKIKKYNFLDIKVNPNPHSNPLKIDFISIKRTAYNLWIYDASGKICVYENNGIFEQGKNNVLLDKHLPKGLYYISVMVNEGITSKKVIIE